MFCHHVGCNRYQSASIGGREVLWRTMPCPLCPMWTTSFRIAIWSSHWELFMKHEGITLVYYVRFPGSAPVSNWFRQMPHMFIIIPLETRFTKLVVFECCWQLSPRSDSTAAEVVWQVACGIQLESSWNPVGIQLESSWNPVGIQLESSWNPGSFHDAFPFRSVPIRLKDLQSPSAGPHCQHCSAYSGTVQGSSWLNSRDCHTAPGPWWGGRGWRRRRRWRSRRRRRRKIGTPACWCQSGQEWLVRLFSWLDH